MDRLDELYREFRELHRQAGGLLCTMAGGMPLPFATPGMRPAVDVYETWDALVIIVEAPGLSESSLEIFLERQYLRVRGYRVRPAPENATRCHRCEVDAGLFDPLIPLPYPPAARDIQAQLETGFLRIALPISPGPGYQDSPQEQDL